MGQVAFYEGDLRGHRGWRLPQRHAGLLERAAAAHRSRGWGEPIEVVDADPARAERRTRELELEQRQGMGPIEHSPWVGRVLSVR